jgi:hypothetical protein
MAEMTPSSPGPSQLLYRLSVSPDELLRMSAASTTVALLPQIAVFLAWIANACNTDRHTQCAPSHVLPH